MRTLRCLHTWLLLFLTAVSLPAQMLHIDTIQASTLTLSPDDGGLDLLMLQMLRDQSLSQRDSLDSVRTAMREADRTNLLTRHLSQQDSLHIDWKLRQRGTITPMTTSFLIYMPQDFSTDFHATARNLPLRKPAGLSTLLPAEQPTVSLHDDDAYVWQLRQEARNHITRTDVTLYTTTIYQLEDYRREREMYMGKREHHNKGVTVTSSITHIDKPIVEASPWTRYATGLAQFTQNYISKNWYKGGSSSLAVLGIITAKATYKNKNIEWDNYAEWRMGFNSVSGDTIHRIAANEDLFKVTSKFGIKALRNGLLNYVATAELQTQFFHTWAGVNSTKLKTGFFSPLRLNVGIGLDYNPHKTLSVVFSPIAYKFIFVSDTAHIDQTAYGISSNSRVLNEVGSSITVTHSWQPLDEIKLDTRLYLYTNYKAIEFELEAVANFIINRFLTTRVSLYPRFDNTVNSTSTERARMQFKELISIGFAHTFK